MQGKLTLSIDKKTIEQAKAYAKKHNKSISQIVETYFKHLSDSEKIENNRTGQKNPTPVTDSLASSLKGLNVKDHKAERSDLITRKHRII